jgi:hypothetical protein
MMMVVFQNKIIYMPGLPPNARRESIEDYETQCYGIKWREENIVAADKTKLSLCVADVVTGRPSGRSESTTIGAEEDLVPVYILYFQG